MRYSGMAERALSVARAYLHEREAFGESLVEKQGLRFDFAEAVIALHSVRSMVRQAAHKVARGDDARTEVSACKVYAANRLGEIIDRSLQLCGSQGIGKDLPLSDFYEEIRQFRIVDGPDEVHKRVVAREALSEYDPDELRSMTRYRVQEDLYQET